MFASSLLAALILCLTATEGRYVPSPDEIKASEGHTRQGCVPEKGPIVSERLCNKRERWGN